MSHKVTIPIGPYHPLQEEPEFYKLIVDGEKVLDVDVRIGWNHRGIEKLSESKSFDQSAYLVERICGICSTSHPFAFVNAVEDIDDIHVPERALYIRTIIGELERIHSHLLWLGLAGHFLGYNTVFMWAWRYREPVLDMFEAISGNRNNYAMMKVGGVRRDIDNTEIPRYKKILNDEVLPAVEMFRGAVLDDPVLAARLKGVGILTREDAIDYSALGPTARASGYDVDIRRDEPYAAYGKVKWNVITRKEGDVFAKAVVRILELIESIKIVNQCLDDLPEGPIDENVKQVSPGDGIGHHEAPRGEVIHIVRCDGTNRPVRHKVRAPTFMNFPTFKKTIVGQTIADATIILAAIDPCYCCTERLTVVNKKDKMVYDAHNLIHMSQHRTWDMGKSLGLSDSELIKRMGKKIE
ncbi:MAG: nickel-dependent hydrogenase large subunit [Candidatus Omnitrophica bacterium]|nr:nickel-dependent hydrogenase large subunit [Candidatus Omnitrophota bacterium]MBU4487506.1 nickel-dependent hydrogenase large subunit [Candidatus Omnitrophota bacterium]MCG2704906.1 nickel-dependent hydrogenase large subunit [Candidatus Omnitrophota bacterium]